MKLEEPKKRAKLTEQQLKKAKEDYLNFKSVSSIAKECGVDRTTIQYHVNSKWRAERNILKTELASALAENKTSQLTEIYGDSLLILSNYIKSLKSKKDLSNFEAKTLTNILESIDKIARLDQGSPTDIIQDTKPATVIEIRKQLAKDPFYTEEIEYVEEDPEDTLS